MATNTKAYIEQKIDDLEPGERFYLDNVDENLYHSLPGIGSTLMKAATKSMRHYDDLASGNKSYSKETLAAFKVGSATHTLVLEPELFASKFVKMPGTIKVRRGKLWEEFRDANASKEILLSSEVDLVQSMALSVTEICPEFFTDGVAERSYWYRHETGIILKARIDYLVDNFAYDLKTTHKDSAEEFAKSLKYDYDIQEAHYRLVSGVDDMLYIGVCKSSPHEVFGAHQGEDVREAALTKIECAISDIAFSEEAQCFEFEPFQIYQTSLAPYEVTQ